MRVAVIDDDTKQNALLYDKIFQDKKLYLSVFTDTQETISFFLENSVDLVFLSVCSEKIDYSYIISVIKKYNDKAVIFLTGNDDIQSVEVYRNRCDYFIKKPYNKDEVDDCMERFRLLSTRLTKKVYVRTFGRFDVFVDGVPVDFHNAKAKELFALCIDRVGGNVSMCEAIDKLWSERHYDEKVKKLYRKAVISIKKALADNGVQGIFDTSRANAYIRYDMIECDYFKLLENPEKYYSLFQGEYMFDYSWAEGTLAKIISKSFSPSENGNFLYSKTNDNSINKMIKDTV
ncbi:MAG: hypothetical protein PUG48_03085 [Clostridia bacterium]|nr:hypothetical protein [Clostridia bacterium]